MKRIVFGVMMILSGILFSCSSGGSVGDGYRTFYAADITTAEYYQLQAAKVMTGLHCEVYVEDQISLPPSMINRIVSKFDNDIYPMVTSKFGEESDVDANGKIIILILDIKDGFDNDMNLNYCAGYFDPGNELSESPDNHFTNMCDMIYVDCYPGNPASTEANGTVAHEFQHLVNYNINGLSNGGAEHEIWLNEGLSSVAECFAQGGDELTYRIDLYNGYIENSKYMLNDTMDNFYMWENSMMDYSTAYLFFQWIRFHSDDDSVFYDITHSSYHDYRAVVEQVRSHVSYYNGLSSAYDETDWSTILGDWLIANQLCFSTGKYGYTDKISGLSKRDIAGTKELNPGESMVTKYSSDYTPALTSHVTYKAFTGSGVVDDESPYNGDYILAYNSNTDLTGDPSMAKLPYSISVHNQTRMSEGADKITTLSSPIPIDAVIGKNKIKRITLEEKE
ncbi:MAG TPA: hypothetical protein PKK43_05120 [Spirochaetota bacterium]|nr:hypothetical protein [Spirochaetota bacterium]